MTVTLLAERAQRIYVAGPMSGILDFNFPAFRAAAEMLRGIGWQVENPADSGQVDGAEWADYMAYDLTRLGLCGAIYLLPGWSKSKGATEEKRIADFLGLKVLYAQDPSLDQGKIGMCPICLAVQENEQNPNTECDQCGWNNQ